MSVPLESQSYRRPGTFTFIKQPEVFLVWLIFTILAALLNILTFDILHGYVAGLALIWWLVLGVVFAHYCINIIESTAKGVDQVQQMTAHGFLDPRLLKLMLVTSGLVSLVVSAPDPIRPYIMAAVLFVTPAMTSYITLSDSLTRALNPLQIGYFVINMGFGYLALRVVMTSVLLYLLFLVEHYTTLFASLAGVFIGTATAVYLLLIMSRCVGALLHARRNELGISTEFSPEQAAAAEQAERDAEMTKFLQPIYDHVRVHRYKEAWELLEARLKRDRYESEQTYFEALMKWEDRTLGHKVAQGYLKRLVDFNSKRAWEILEEIFEAEGGDYRLDSGDAVLKFADTATTDAQRRISLHLLGYFDTDFPSHPRTREAYLKATDLACELDDMSLAAQYFDIVAHRRGLVHKPTYERCRRLIEGWRAPG